MYHGQYGIDKVIEDNYLEDFDPNGWLVECGAGNGISDSVCLHFEQEYGFRVINIEAVRELYLSLYNNRPNTMILGFALSSYNGKLKFHLAEKQNETSGGSASYKKGFDTYLKNTGYSLTEIEVPCKTYDYVVSKPDFKVELFVLDVEGHELEVIQGMNISLPKVICIEYTLSGLDEIKSVLIPKGYRFDFVSENNALFSRGIPEKIWTGKTDLWRS